MFIGCGVLCMLISVFSISVSKGRIEGNAVAVKASHTVNPDDDWTVVRKKCIFCDSYICRADKETYSEAIADGFGIVLNDSKLIQCQHCGGGFAHLLCLLESYYNRPEPNDSCECIPHFRDGIRQHVAELFENAITRQSSYTKKCLDTLFTGMSDADVKDFCRFESKNEKQLRAIAALIFKRQAEMAGTEDLGKIMVLHFIVGMILDELDGRRPFIK